MSKSNRAQVLPRETSVRPAQAEQTGFDRPAAISRLTRTSALADRGRKAWPCFSRISLSPDEAGSAQRPAFCVANAKFCVLSQSLCECSHPKAATGSQFLWYRLSNAAGRYQISS